MDKRGIIPSGTLVPIVTARSVSVIPNLREFHRGKFGHCRGWGVGGLALQDSEWNIIMAQKGWGPLCLRGPPLEYGGGGAGVFFEINIFVGKMGEINNWPQGFQSLL